MKKIAMMALACLCVLGIATSCGGSDNKETKEEVKKDQEFKVKPENTKVKGALADLFEVVDKEYTVKKDGGSYKFMIEVKRLEEVAPWGDNSDIVYAQKGSDSTASWLGGFGIEFLDKDGNVIETVSPMNGSYSWDDTTTALRLNPGETGTLTLSVYPDNDDFQPASFRVTSDLQPNDKKKEETSASDDDDDHQTLAEFEEEFNKGKEAAEKELKDALEDKDIQDLKDAYETTKDVVKLGSDIVKTAGKLAF